MSSFFSSFSLTSGTKRIGISTFASHPQTVGDQHLKLLLDFAMEVVPEQAHATTPVFLMATAGMRLLPENEQKAILEASCKYIREQYPFAVDDCDTHVRVIKGELEGIYGWVAVNYLMGGFDTSIQSYIDHPEQEADRHHTFGFLDMGGASAQIAFEPEHHQKQEHFDDLTRIYLHTLDGQKVEYDVFVTTFLGYGSNEARRRYLEERVRSMAAHSKGDNKSVLLDEHHSLHLDDPCLPFNLTLTDTHSTSIPLTLHGTGSFSECLKATAPLLNKNAECPTKPCLFNGVHTPHIDWSVNKFVGISEYWYSSHDILGLGGVYDFQEYERKATEYCAKNWSDIMAHRTSSSNSDDAADIQHHQMQCFKSAWIVNVLHDGIEIPRIVDPGYHHNSGAASTTKDQELLEQSIESIEAKNWSPPFQSIDTINDIQVSWTLGAMVLHVANLIPLVDPSEAAYHSTDDEGPRSDGVEFPHPLDSNRLWGEDNNTSLTVMVVMLCCSLIFWCLYRRGKRRGGGMDDGLLGNNSNFSGTTASNRLGKFINALTRSSLLRSLISRISSKGSGSRLSTSAGVQGGVFEVDTFSSGEQLGDSLAINITTTSSTSGSSSPALRPPPSRSHSAINMKGWKKRLSGDSHSALLPPAADSKHHLPLRSSSSAVNLANRAGMTTSSSNNDNIDS